MSTQADRSASPRRSLWAAGILALITPGLGLLYCGRLRAAIYVLTATILLWIMDALIGNAALKIVIVFAITALYAAQIIWSAVLAARIGENYTFRKYNRVMVYALVFMLFAAYNELDSRFLTEITAISTSSMRPLLSANDFIIVNKLALELGKPHPGDVVVYLHRADSRFPYVGQVMAGPHDEIAFRSGQYLVNGRTVEQRVKSVPTDLRVAVPLLRDMPSLKLGDGEYFIAGANQVAAYDSRFTGPVKAGLILGRIDAVLYSTVKKSPIFADIR